MQLLQIGFLRFVEIIPQAPHWGLSFSFQQFEFLFSIKMRLHTLITAYLAADIPGLRALHFPQASILWSR